MSDALSELPELVVLAALAGAPAGLAADELMGVLEGAGADAQAALDSAEKLLVAGSVRLEGARFVIRNPNAASTCGCGSSFSV